MVALIDVVVRVVPAEPAPSSELVVQRPNQPNNQNQTSRSPNYSLPKSQPPVHGVILSIPVHLARPLPFLEENYTGWIPYSGASVCL